MLGSASSISDANVMLNTMTADVFCEFADRLEKADNFEKEVDAIIKETFREHKRIVFNGDGYSEKWQEEAKKRGLLNLKSTPDAIPYLCRKENIELFARHGVFSETELRCRADIALENYCKVIHIEALTLIEMAKRDILPAISKTVFHLCKTIEKNESVLGRDPKMEKSIATYLSDRSEKLYEYVGELEETVEKTQTIADIHERSVNYHDAVLSLMESVREIADKTETLGPRKEWPYPTYGDLLFKV